MHKTSFAMLMAGVTIGAAAAWLYLKKHYEQIAQEEIDSVKAAFAAREEANISPPSEDNATVNEKKANTAKLKPDIINYAAKLQEEDYMDYAAKSNRNDKEDGYESMNKKPYVISPEEYGNLAGNTRLSLTYYSDGTLADDEDEIVDNIEETVGSDFTKHFGYYEADSVWIRNNRLKCDYEILKDNRSYERVTGLSPNRED